MSRKNKKIEALKRLKELREKKERLAGDNEKDVSSCEEEEVVVCLNHEEKFINNEIVRGGGNKPNKDKPGKKYLEEERKRKTARSGFCPPNNSTPLLVDDQSEEERDWLLEFVEGAQTSLGYIVAILAVIGLVWAHSLFNKLGQVRSNLTSTKKTVATVRPLKNRSDADHIVWKTPVTENSPEVIKAEFVKKYQLQTDWDVSELSKNETKTADNYKKRLNNILLDKNLPDKEKVSKYLSLAEEFELYLENARLKRKLKLLEK